MSIKSKVTGSISEVSQYDSGGNITGMTLGNINIVNANIGNANIQNAALTASNLSMDVANLHIIGGSNNQVLTTDGTGNLFWAPSEGNPGGNNTQIQFNSNGAFGGNPNLTFTDGTSGSNLLLSSLKFIGRDSNSYSNIIATKGLSITAGPGTSGAPGDINLTAGSNIAGNIGNISLTGNVQLGEVANVHITGGSNGQVLTTDGAGNLSFTTVSGGGNGTPAGANTQIQFNSNGAFGGSPNLTWNGNVLIAENVYVPGLLSTQNGLETWDNANRIMTELNWDFTGPVRSGYFQLRSVDTGNGNVTAIVGIAIPTTPQFAASGGYELTLPPNAGSNGQFLQTDGLGNLSWANGGNGGGSGNSISEGNSNVIVNNANTLFSANGVANVMSVGTTAGNASNVVISSASGAILSVTNTGSGISQTISPASISTTGGGTMTLQSGNSNVRIASNGNVSVSVAGTSNVLTISGNSVSLGSNSNVKITGGSSSQFLQTDGTGNLSWSNAGIIVSNQTGNVANGYVFSGYNNIGSSGELTITGVIPATGGTIVVGDSISVNGNIYTVNTISPNFPTSGQTVLAVTPNVVSESPSSVFVLRQLSAISQVTQLVMGSGLSANLTDSIGNVVTITSTGGGGNATPAGSNTQVQFNANGAFGASANFTFDGSNVTLGNDSNATRVLNLASGSNPFFIQNLSNANSYVAIDPTSVAIKNLVLVNSRANLGNAANIIIGGGTNGYVLQTDGAGNLSWTAQTGGGGNATPAGANTQVQFNNAGSFGASANLTFDGANLTVAGNATAGNLLSNGVVRVTTAVGGQGEFQISDGQATSFIVGVGNTGATWAGSGSLNLITSTSPGGNVGIFVAQSETARFTTTGASVTGNLGVLGKITGGANYVQPGFIQLNSNDANWTYGIDGDGATNFWLQAQFRGQNQSTRGFRVLENEGNTVVFSVNGSGVANVSGSLNVVGNIGAGNISASATGTISTFNLTANGTANLGAVGNVKITGGSNGQFLRTDGTGNLSFANVGSPVGTSHGQVWSNANVTFGLANTGVAVTFNNISDNSGLSIGTPSSRVIIANPGTYNIMFSAQVQHPSGGGGGTANCYFWFAQNGTAIPDSAGLISAATGTATLQTYNVLVTTTAANEYVEFYVASSDTGVTLPYYGANSIISGMPGLPSVILTVTTA